MAKEKEENLWRGKIYFSKEMKNGEGKGEKYLEKENIFILRMRRKRMIYFEKEKNICCGGKEKRRRKRKKIFVEEECHYSGTNKRQTTNKQGKIELLS